MGREEVLESTRPVSALVCWLTYICSLGWIAFCFAVPQVENQYWNGFVAITEATGVIFAFSLCSRNTSLYDPAWVFLPCAIAIGWMCTATSGAGSGSADDVGGGAAAVSARAWYGLASLLAWLLRYNIWFLWEGWTKGIDAEDWRYAETAKVRSLSGLIAAAICHIASELSAART